MTAAPSAALVDYGVGNMHSIRKALHRVGFAVRDAAAPADLQGTDAIVLPGVGAFTPAAGMLAPYARAIRDRVDDGCALLGVCLGMQLLYDESEEGDGQGLGLFHDRVTALDHPRIPHIGWAPLRASKDPFVDGLDGRHVYHVHSFAAPGGRPEVVATVDYGGPFAAIVRKGRVVGTQFHPEKSSTTGLDVLARFRRVVEGDL